MLVSTRTCAAGSVEIQSISPSQGPIAGGGIVTIAGFGFTGTALTLDGAAITPISASDTQITFRTPPHDNGIASVKLTGNGPNAYTEFLYIPPSLKSLPAGYITTVMGIGNFRGDGRQATNAVVAPAAMAPASATVARWAAPGSQTDRSIRLSRWTPRGTSIFSISITCASGRSELDPRLVFGDCYTFDPWQFG